MKVKSNYSGFNGIIKFLSTVISWTALVILILLSLFLAYYFIGNKISELNDGKFEPIISLYTIVSPSMTPNINVGDVIVSKKINNPQKIKVGDVITFISTSSISKGMIITHRVVEIGEDENGVTYKTKGDNNLSPDSSPAQYNNVIGKVVLRIPKLGKLQSLLANKGGWFIVILVPALFIIISDILKIFKLVGVKNKIEKIDESNKIEKQKQTEKEKERKEELIKRLAIEKERLEKEKRKKELLEKLKEEDPKTRERKREEELIKRLKIEKEQEEREKRKKELFERIKKEEEKHNMELYQKNRNKVNKNKSKKKTSKNRR